LPYLRFRSKLIYEDLKSYCEYASAVWFVPKQILNNSKNIQKEFLKALFDDEGSVIPYGKTAILRLYSINLKGLKEIQELLQNFNFDSVIVVGFGCKRNVYGLTIKDISNFHHKIGFYCIRKQKKLLKYVKEV
ncbi:MAG: LAGLIDADG family homing endonuclease, partial [Nanoarchaeota archaeon]|nr:LAGLIDADG family homing endonuclease [Nanoarchaeota archaeon]